MPQGFSFPGESKFFVPSHWSVGFLEVVRIPMVRFEQGIKNIGFGFWVSRFGSKKDNPSSRNPNSETRKTEPEIRNPVLYSFMDEEKEKTLNGIGAATLSVLAGGGASFLGCTTGVCVFGMWVGVDHHLKVFLACRMAFLRLLCDIFCL